MFERTLVLIKPDAVLRRGVGVNCIKDLMAIEGINLILFEETVVPKALGQLHYGEHATTSYFGFLIETICQPGGVIAMVFQGENAVEKVRNAIGPAFVDQASRVPEFLRGKYGIVNGINSVHASSSHNEAEREIGLWVGTFGWQMNFSIANDKAKEYINKYLGSTVSVLVKAEQEMCMDIKKSVGVIKVMLDKECSADEPDRENKINALLRVILLSFRYS